MDIINKIEKYVNENTFETDKRKMDKILKGLAKKIDLSSLSKKDIERLYSEIFKEGYKIGKVEGIEDAKE